MFAITVYLSDNPHRSETMWPVEAAVITKLVKAETYAEAVGKLNLGGDCYKIEIVPVVGDEVE